MESGLGPLKPHLGHNKLASADLNHQNCHKNICGLNWMAFLIQYDSIFIFFFILNNLSC